MQEELAARAKGGRQEVQATERRKPEDRDSLADAPITIAEICGATLRQVEAALRRITQGTYGICGDCGAEIPLARLESMPVATRCVLCQEREEQFAKASTPSVAHRRYART